jgi:hypothetical protein
MLASPEMGDDDTATDTDADTDTDTETETDTNAVHLAGPTRLRGYLRKSRAARG